MYIGFVAVWAVVAPASVLGYGVDGKRLAVVLVLVIASVVQKSDYEDPVVYSSAR